MPTGQATDLVVVWMTPGVTGTLADVIARAVGAVGVGRGDQAALGVALGDAPGGDRVHMLRLVMTSAVGVGLVVREPVPIGKPLHA